MGDEKYKLLIIEDDEDITNLLKINLEDMGYHVTLAHDGKTGYEKVLGQHVDLLILDLMLPGLDGLEICRRVRAKNHYIPILMITCKSSEIDRVVGLEMGADDYLTKPFSIKELLARVKALFRRVEAMKSPSSSNEEKEIKAGKLLINTEKRSVTFSGKSLHLTAREFDLLYYFARNPGRVFTRTQLLDKVWGYGYESYEHTVNSHINRLRAKIETDPANPVYILTVWGVGYKFADDLQEQS